MASNRIDLSAAAWRKSSYSNGSGGNCVEVAEGFVGAARWRKSSHSNGSGGDCVEVADGFVGAARWRKSSYSNTSGGDCVEVADDLPGVVPVRDSKVPDGPVVTVSARAWVPFVAAVKGAGAGAERCSS
ncbi:DUF397 domain-containing protein [Streptomyces sp. TRM64462]|uniref:DUF397 domain-containing protein n=1 Tax=Streptomyces sp. TRM64462 TaxID=2741726 RepID=UPI0015865860|nr:DUF397 domain-containing protein [Streptomyces sp. TRM64462]